MTEPKDRDESGGVPNGEEEDAGLRDLLSTAMSDVGEPPKDMVRRVQRTIRKRSKGRFFSDGWSTMGVRANYFIVAVTMLVIAGVAYFVLHPSGFQ